MYHLSGYTIRIAAALAASFIVSKALGHLLPTDVATLASMLCGMALGTAAIVAFPSHRGPSRKGDVEPREADWRGDGDGDWCAVQELEPFGWRIEAQYRSRRRAEARAARSPYLQVRETAWVRRRNAQLLEDEHFYPALDARARRDRRP